MTQYRSAVLVLFAFVVSVFAQAQVQAYDPPSIYRRSSTFYLTANGRKITVLSHDEYDYAHFSAIPGVKIEVTVLAKTPMSDVTITPARPKAPVKMQLRKNKLSWQLQSDRYIIIKIDELRELVIATDPIEEYRPALSGKGIYNVLNSKYRADKSGRNLSTSAFEAAFADAAGEKQPNTPSIVYVPPGVYTIGNLVLPSRTSLYLAGGAVLRFSGRPSDYKKHWGQDGEGRSGTYWITTAHNSTDIKIYGRGTIDANAFSYARLDFASAILVPVMTKGFIFDGPILRESGSTAFTLVRSSSAVIKHMKVFNRMGSMLDNGSVDILESQNVLVSDSIGVSVSDSFTTKASKPAGPKVPGWPGALQPSTNVVFKNCVAWTSNYGFKVGQGAMQNQTNIKFTDNTVYNAAVAMGIHKKWGSGSVTNVTFENMIVKQTTYTTSHLSGMIGSWLALFVEDGKAGVGPITGVRVRNVLVQNEGGSGPLIQGLANAIVSDVTFENVRLPGIPRPAKTLAELEMKELKHFKDVKLVSPESKESKPAEIKPVVPPPIPARMVARNFQY